MSELSRREGRYLSLILKQSDGPSGVIICCLVRMLLKQAIWFPDSTLDKGVFGVLVKNGYFRGEVMMGRGDSIVGRPGGNDAESGREHLVMLFLFYLLYLPLECGS